MIRKLVVVVPGFYEERKLKMPKSSKLVFEKRSSLAKGNQADVTKERQSKKTFKVDIEEQITKSLNASRSLLRTIFSAHMALLHWQPMPHQHIIDFLGKYI